MTSENVQADEVNEPAKASRFRITTTVANISTESRVPRDVVAFKFGGTSVLGAERMLHASQIVRAATCASSVVVIVSAMKGVTDHLLAIGTALENGKLAAAKHEAESVIATHLAVLRDLQLAEPDDLRVRREMLSLAQDLLHDVAVKSTVTGHPELLDRLASYGERFQRSAPRRRTRKIRRGQRARYFVGVRPHLRNVSRCAPRSARNS